MAGKDLKDLRLPGWKVHQVGLVPVTRMLLVYRAADVLLDTAAEDNLPNVVLEAMASGLPVVAHRVGGVEDQLGGKDPSGVLFSPENPEAGARGLREVLGNPTMAKELSRRAMDRIRTTFTLSRQARAMIGLYRSLKQRPVSPREKKEEGASLLWREPAWKFWAPRWRKLLFQG